MKKLPLIRFTAAGSSLFKEKASGEAVLPEGLLVGVAGLEPAASWSRTMRDTKLRHTPKSYSKAFSL